jgi:hypothetical protein
VNTAPPRPTSEHTRAATYSWDVTTIGYLTPDRMLIRDAARRALDASYHARSALSTAGRASTK